jgi:hypothetical protein
MLPYLPPNFVPNYKVKDGYRSLLDGVSDIMSRFEEKD